MAFRIGYIGLGKMGSGMALRLLERGAEVVAYDSNADAVRSVAVSGVTPALSIEAVVGSLAHPRVVWLMVPHATVDSVIAELLPFLEKGDIVIDGGNSPYKESIRRHDELMKRSIEFLDVGVSGGPGGARSGACVMVGGSRELFDRYERLWKMIATEDGYDYMGPSGAGHFVKMVHNGIEYGMMQALAEGFAILKASPYDLDLGAVAELYNHQSVITSRLVGWLKSAYERNGKELTNVSGAVGHTGEGAWTVEAAKELGIPANIIEGALEFRKHSAETPSYTGKVLSALRYEFGGHETGRSF